MYAVPDTGNLIPEAQIKNRLILLLQGKAGEIEEVCGKCSKVAMVLGPWALFHINYFCVCIYIIYNFTIYTHIYIYSYIYMFYGNFYFYMCLCVHMSTPAWRPEI